MVLEVVAAAAAPPDDLAMDEAETEVTELDAAVADPEVETEEDDVLLVAVVDDDEDEDAGTLLSQYAAPSPMSLQVVEQVIC